MFGAVIAPAKLPALRQLADDYQPDLIIHAEVDIAAPLLPAERGLPSVTYGFAQPLDPSMLAALAERVAPLWQSAGLNPDPYAGIYRDRYLDPCPASLQGERGPAAAVAEPIRPEIPGDPGASLPDWAAALGRCTALVPHTGPADIPELAGRSSETEHSAARRYTSLAMGILRRGRLGAGRITAGDAGPGAQRGQPDGGGLAWRYTRRHRTVIAIG